MNKTYTETVLVRGTECDAYHRMRMDAIFLSMQEAGETHARKLGMGHAAMLSLGYFFVLTRVHVAIHRAPVAGETLIHTTWPGVSNRFFCPRHHEMRAEDGTLLVTAASLWCILDVNKRSIISPLKIDLPFPDNSDLTPPIAAPNRLPVIAEPAQHITRTPVYSEFDVNGHVNNTKYIAWLCDALGRKTLKDAYISDLVVGYEKEIRMEEPLDLAISLQDDAFTFCVVSASGEKHFAAGGTLRREEQV